MSGRFRPLLVPLVLGVMSAGIVAGAQTRAREGTIDLSGVHLFYVDTGGAGQPVVFLHAATGSSQVWEHQVPVFVAAGYRVITYDRRGFGRSIVDPTGPQPGTGADDLLALVNYLRIERFHLVGTAAGGFVAFDFALSFPDRLQSLVVANSIGGVQDEEFAALNRRLRPPSFAALPADVRELGPSYRATNPDGTERWLAFERTNHPGGTPAPTQGLRNKLTFARLESLTVPTLLLTGDADLFAPPAIMKMFSSRIRNAESVTVPEAGHSTYWEQPEVFNDHVLAFLRRHR